MHLNFFYISWQTEPPKIAKKYQKLIEPFDFFFFFENISTNFIIDIIF